MIPGRVACLPENLLGLSWHDTVWIPMLNTSNVMDYFSERTNPFYDRTCNNEIVKMQRLNPDQLVNMTGLEYMLLHVQEPILYVIRKLHRHSPTQVTVLAEYYIIAGVVYQAPDLGSIINSRLLTTTSTIQSAFDSLFNIYRFHPSRGYTWDTKSQSGTAAATKTKKNTVEEPSSSFQRQRVDVLLGELIQRFPIPVIKQEPQEFKMETNTDSSAIKMESKIEIKQEIKEEKQEINDLPPSMKPPPEKKPKLT